MIDNDSHIAIVHDERLPENILDEFCTGVTAESLVIDRIARPAQGPQMGIEWLAFPALALFLLKPYFDSFLNEAGKEHYSILSKCTKTLWRKFFGENREFRAAIATASGVKQPVYSIAFAVYTITEDGRLLKLLIRENCSENEFRESIDAFMDLVNSYHKGILDDELRATLFEEGSEKSIVLLEFNKDSGSLRVVYPTARLRDTPITEVE